MVKKLIALCLIIFIMAIYFLTPKTVVAYNTKNLTIDNNRTNTKVVMQTNSE